MEGAPAPAAAAAEDGAAPPPQAAAPPAPMLNAKGSVGWQGSVYQMPLVDGVHEHRAAIAKRRRLRLLPEINAMISALWAVGVKRGVRMDLKAYMDYHLSCYYFVTAMDEQVTVDKLQDDHVSLYEAWENALCDWKEDTQDMLKKYNNRSLHFDSFRDSVFELIDLYTPTTDEKQYVGYLKRLMRQICVVDGKGVPTSWRRTWPKVKVAKDAKKLADALRAAVAGEDFVGDGHMSEKNVGLRYTAWHTQQEEERKEILREEAKTKGEPELTEEKLELLYEPWDELMPRGLANACETYDSSLLPLPTDEHECEVAVVALFRLLDIDLSGGLSRSDLVTSLRDGEQSAWLEGKHQKKSTLGRR